MQSQSARRAMLACIDLGLPPLTSLACPAAAAVANSKASAATAARCYSSRSRGSANSRRKQRAFTSRDAELLHMELDDEFGEGNMCVFSSRCGARIRLEAVAELAEHPLTDTKAPNFRYPDTRDQTVKDLRGA
jgi:hypothetical protein